VEMFGEDWAEPNDWGIDAMIATDQAAGERVEDDSAV